MPAQVFGAQATAVELFIAFYGAAPGNAIYNNLVAVESASSPQALALTIGNQFATTSDADLAKMVLTNLGISAATTNQAAYDALLAGLTGAFAAYPTQRGIVVLNLANILTTLETNTTYGAAAQAFNQTVTTSYVYASNPANTQTQTTSSITTATPLSVNAGDVVNGTAGNDSINGNLFFNSPSGTFFQTLNTGDVVNGGAGTDTINVGFNNGAGQNLAATLSSIENLSVNATGTANTTIDMTNGTGLATVSVTNGQAGGDVVLTNVGTLLTTASLTNSLAGLTVTSTAATVAGTADAIALNLNQAGNTTTAPTVSLAGYETINLASSGPATNNITLGYSSGATVTATGTTSVAISTGASTNAVTINASGMTGAGTLRVDASGAANNVNVTGTANNDTVVLGANYTTSDTVNGGAGTDTLSVTQAMAGAVVTNQANLSNLETLSFSDAVGAATYTPAVFGGATTLALTAASANNFTVNYGTGTAGLTLTAGNTGTATLNSAGSATTDVLNLTSGSATTGSLTHGNVATTGFETINLTSNGALGSTNTFGTIVMTATAASETLNVTGARDVSVGAVTADVINASALTGNLTMTAASTSAPFPVVASGVQITGGSGNDSLVGSAAADVIAGGAGNDRLLVGATDAATQADILTGGAGNDQFRFVGSAQASLLKMSSGTAQVVKVTDFVAGADKIALVGGGFTTASLATTQTVATAADLTAVYGGITAVAASTATNASAVIVNVTAGLAAGTYLYINDGNGTVTAANDMLINITGLTGTFSTGDFVFT